MTNLPLRRSSLYLLPIVLLGLVSAVACTSVEQKGEVPPDPRASTNSHLEQAASNAATPDAFASKYAELRAQGKSHKAATELAMIYTGGTPTGGTRAKSQQAMDAAVLLAKFSATDTQESARREQAAEELKKRFQSRDLDADHALNLLGEIAPDASTDERREVANSLARLSGADKWNDGNTMDAADELIRLIAGDASDAERRIKAAKELAMRSSDGGLDADRTLKLVNDIAPGLSIDERKDAAVDLTGEAIKKFNSEKYDDEDVDAATELIKRSLSGDLDAEGVSDLLKLER